MGGSPWREPALLERLYVEIRRLPPLDRSLVPLSLDGVSYADMAQIHGLSESNVGCASTAPNNNWLGP